MKLALLVGCLAAAPPLILVSLSLLKPASAAALDIHAAVREDSPLKIQDALEAGESVNKIGPGGQTPLMHGVLQGKLDAVEALLTAGADVTIGEKDGYTPMHGAGFQGRAAVAKALLAHGLDPSDRHQDGFTPLHRACWGGEQRHTDMVRVLLEAGVPYDQPASNGQRPLDMVRGNKATTKLLKEWAKKADAAQKEL